MALTYYAQRKSIKNGQPVAPNNRYGEHAEVEEQTEPEPEQGE